MYWNTCILCFRPTTEYYTIYVVTLKMYCSLAIFIVIDL